MLGVAKMDNVRLVDVTCWVRMLVQKFGVASTVNSYPWAVLQAQSIATLGQKADLSAIVFPVLRAGVWTRYPPLLASRVPRLRRLDLGLPNPSSPPHTAGSSYRITTNSV